MYYYNDCCYKRLRSTVNDRIQRPPPRPRTPISIMSIKGSSIINNSSINSIMIMIIIHNNMIIISYCRATTIPRPLRVPDGREIYIHIYVCIYIYI